MKEFFKTYFDFNYGVGFVIGVVIFGGYIWMVNQREMKRGGKISGREMFWGLALSVYMVFLLGTTLLNRTLADGQGVRLELFWSYRELFQERSWEMAKQILYNVLAFVPWGILVPKCFENWRSFVKVVGSAVVASACIELIQFVGQCGLCELDDVVHNGLGAVIGYGVYRLWFKN